MHDYPQFSIYMSEGKKYTEGRTLKIFAYQVFKTLSNKAITGSRKKGTRKTMYNSV